jgi:SAM-dependent methyltransferase
MEYTGERYDPAFANALAFYDHYTRYHFVKRRFGGARNLLDIGCGLGVGTRFMRDAFDEAIGVDPSGDAVAEANRRFAAPRLRFLTLGQLESQLAEQFDVVTCLEVIEHTLEQRQLAELVRMRVRTGGVAIFSTPNVEYTRAHGLVNPYHVRELTQAEFSEVLGASFPQVRMYAMVQVNGAVLAAPGGRATGLALEQIHCSPGDRVEEMIPPETVSHFLAVCSFADMPETPGLAVLDPRSTYVEELQRIIKDQARMVDARDEAFRSAERLIRARDEALAAQTVLIDDRDAAIVRQTEMIDERDRVIATQARLVNERDAALAQLRAELERAREPREIARALLRRLAGR